MRRRSRAADLKFIREASKFVAKNSAVFVAVFLLLALAACAVFWVYNFLSTSASFDCYAIEIMKLGEEDVPSAQPACRQAGKEFFKLSPKVNIFKAAPIAMSAKIKGAHPEFQTVLITKYLPNRLIATIIDRRPVAVIKAGKVYQVDYEGMVLPAAVSNAQAQNLPLIIGLEPRLFSPAVGKKLKSQKLEKALGLLALISKTRALKDSVVESIDVSSPENTTFTMDGIDVIIGEGEYQNKVELLVRILGDRKVDKPSIDYVDLRFTDVVIGTKTAKR